MGTSSACHVLRVGLYPPGTLQENQQSPVGKQWSCDGTLPHQCDEGPPEIVAGLLDDASLAGIVLYAFLNARRERLGQIPEPADNPPDDTATPVPADTQREPAAGKGET